MPLTINRPRLRPGPKVNPIRKELVKNEYLRTGGNGYKALKAGGLSESTARHRVRSDNRLLNVVRAEIVRDITQEITVKSVLESLKHIQDLAIRNRDFSTATRCEELCGKWLAMFTDKQEISETEKPNNQFSLDRLSKIRVNSDEKLTLDAGKLT